MSDVERAMPQVGDPVRIQMMKSDGERSWTWSGSVVAETSDGMWLLTEPGPDAAFDKHEKHVMLHTPMLTLVPRHAWWVARFYGPAPFTLFDGRKSRIEIYVDVAKPAEWRLGHDGSWLVRAVDLELDAVRALQDDGTRLVWLEDEDEFQDAIEKYGYPAEVIKAAQQSAKERLAALRDQTPPFNTEYERFWKRNHSA